MCQPTASAQPFTASEWPGGDGHLSMLGECVDSPGLRDVACEMGDRWHTNAPQGPLDLTAGEV